ncbi:MAG: hypothetical protein ACJ8J0_18725 [Longimicrobiaceae bacterium]
MRSTPFAAHLRTLLALAALAAAPVTASAQQGPPPGAPPSNGPSLRLVLQGKLEMGGDPVATVLFEDGSEQKVVTGQGATFAVGAQARPSRTSPFAVRATGGVKFMTTAATNADIFLLRFPLELVGTYDFAHDFHAGGGVVYHTGLKFYGGGVGDDLEFDNATGATVEVGWRWLALSYTKIDYTDESGQTYNASNVGLVFNVLVGPR